MGIQGASCKKGGKYSIVRLSYLWLLLSLQVLN